MYFKYGYMHIKIYLFTMVTELPGRLQAKPELQDSDISITTNARPVADPENLLGWGGILGG